MSEKLYGLLFKLYPEHFRRAYGDEALRLVRERARDEKGLLSGLRLWLDLLVDLAVSLPREYSEAPMVPVATADPFQLLAERSVSPALLFLGGTLSAVLFCSCVTVIAHSRTYPGSFQDPHSLQWLVQSDLPRSRPAVPSSAYSFCMTARQYIPKTSAQPLFTFTFGPSGASGVALVDGNLVETFRNEQRVLVRANVVAGDHEFVLELEKSARNIISISRNDDLQYCPPE